jgi:hypothetical protein
VVDLEAPQLGGLLSLSEGRVLGVNHAIGGQLVVGACAPANYFVTTPLHHAEHKTLSRAAHRWRQSRYSQRCDRTSSTSTQCCPRASSGGHRGRTPAAKSRQRVRVRSESICTCSKVHSSVPSHYHFVCASSGKNFYAVFTRCILYEPCPSHRPGPLEGSWKVDGGQDKGAGGGLATPCIIARWCWVATTRPPFSMTMQQ